MFIDEAGHGRTWAFLHHLLFLRWSGVPIPRREVQHITYIGRSHCEYTMTVSKGEKGLQAAVFGTYAAFKDEVNSRGKLNEISEKHVMRAAPPCKKNSAKRNRVSFLKTISSKTGRSIAAPNDEAVTFKHSTDSSHTICLRSPPSPDSSSIFLSRKRSFEMLLRRTP